MNYKKPEKLLNKNFILLILISLITSFGYNMIMTLVSSYAVELGSKLTMAGTVAGIFSISALLSRPFSGYATDVFNKKTMCVLSTLLIGVAMLGYVIAPNISTFLVMRIIHGLAFGISGTANLALVSEYIPDENMGQGLGYFGLGQVMAQVAGPSIGIYIKDLYGYDMLFIIISLLTFSAAVILQFSFKYKATPMVSENPEKGKKHEKLAFGSLIAKECIMYALIGGLFSLGNGIVNSFLVLVGQDRSIANIALFFSVNAIVLFVMRLTIGKVADKTKLIIMVNISLLFSAASMAMAGFTSVFAVMMAAAALKAIGQGGGQISLQSACIKKVSPAKVGVATSTFFIGADIGQGLGPIIGGKISDLFGYQTMFTCVAALLIFAIVVFTIYEKRVTSLSKVH
ncbi:MAG TPA: MFS transporter [Clostridia bacterium]|nr:MFS transporter [Clostridia bacterium]